MDNFFCCVREEMILLTISYSTFLVVILMFYVILPAGANSTEFDAKTPHPVVIEMPEHNPGDMGGTMRLGKRKTIFKHKDSIISESLFEWEEPRVSS